MPVQQKIHSRPDQSLSSAAHPRGSLGEQAAAAEHIRAKVQMVTADERCFGVLSSGERIAVAVVLDRYDLIQRAWGTIAEAIYRLGPLWTEAALRVQRDGWEQEHTTP
jgi:hypothetical protein